MRLGLLPCSCAVLALAASACGGSGGDSAPAFSWATITADTSAQPNHGYVADAATRITLLLPPASALAVGDRVELLTQGEGWVNVAPSAGQAIRYAPGDLAASTRWNPTTAPTAAWTCLASSADGSHLVAGVASGGVWTSDDSGASWTQRTRGLPASADWAAVTSSADGTRLLAVPHGRVFYTSADAGETWTARTDADPGMPNASWSSAASSSSGEELAVVSYNTLMLSTDFGAHWRLVLSTGTNGYPLGAAWVSVAMSADGATLVLADEHVMSLYVSADGGATWTARATGVPPNAWWTSVASSSDGARLATVGSTIYTSSNSGASWSHETSGLPAAATWSSVASTSDGSRLVAAVRDGGIYSTHTGALAVPQWSTVELTYLGGGEFLLTRVEGAVEMH